MLDLSKIKLTSRSKTQETDPLKIFESLTQRGKVETLSGPQQEALKKWHDELRKKEDVMFSMSTGGGKTLVGILAAQSLVNELRGRVLYLCPTNQLVEQTAAQATDCSLKVATYMAGRWTNEPGYQQCEYCAVTNYHAAFTGRSKLIDDTVKAIIFDDAHVAPSVIRDCFTIKIVRTHSAWNPLIAIFSDYFLRSPYAARFRRFADPGGKHEEGVLFVPGWFAHRHAAKLAEAITESDDDDAHVRLPLVHLIDHLPKCAIFLSSSEISITPTVLPTHALPVFRPGVRRIYLTATLPSRYESIRTFGAKRAEPITPSGKMGAAQKLFLLPPASETTDTFNYTRALISDFKACVIVPTKRAATRWTKIGSLYDAVKGHAKIKSFSEAHDAQKLILAGIFDGIDLPGKACRVLVLDGIPRGASLHDRFVEDVLESRWARIPQIAARVTQAIGRIFRSNTDHGVVILAEKSLQNWLRAPAHAAFLPPLVQQQLQLGFSLQEQFSNQPSHLSLMEKVMGGAPDWDKLYKDNIAEMPVEDKPKQPGLTDDIAWQEYQAWRAFWQGKYAEAAGALGAIADKLENEDPGLSAWDRHWSGVALLIKGDVIAAQRAFQQAANIKPALGRMENELGVENLAPFSGVVSSQAERMADFCDPDAPARIAELIKNLEGDGGPNAVTHEVAIASLGTRLGFVTSRPDKESKKGPDVLWLNPEVKGACGIEAKTQKTSPRAYKKHHIGKLAQDKLWIDGEHPNSECHLIILGPLVPVVSQATPPGELRVVPMESFLELAESLRRAERRIASKPSTWTTSQAAQEALQYYKLVWPGLLDNLSGRLATELQEGDADEAEGGAAKAGKHKSPPGTS